MTDIRTEMMNLGGLLRTEKESLLAGWREQVRSLPGAAGLDVPALNDHMPDLIEELACALEAACGPVRLPPPVTDNAEVHGRQRFEVGFDVGEIIAEYRLLRTCVQNLAEASGLSFCGEMVHIVNQVIDDAVARAVETYVAHQVEETRRRREEHLAFIAHDMKTPVAAISMATTLLERSLSEESKSDNNRMLLDTLRRNVGRMDALIKAVVREETRIDLDSDFVLHRREFDLWPLVQGLIYDLKPLAASSGTRFINSVPEDMVVYADASALAQVFQNLLSNALKYSPGGKITINARRLERAGAAECSVNDTGEGIEPHRLNKIFEKGETDRRQGGTGLGLAIVKRVIEAHGGRVWSESKRGEGAAFFLTLPGRVESNDA